MKEPVMSIEHSNTSHSITNDLETLRLLVENTTDYAILTLDARGTIQGWNVGAERLFGYTAQEVQGKSLVLLFTPEDVNCGVVEQELERAAVIGRANDDRWLLRRDGNRFYANGVLTALRHEDGSLRGYAKIVRDQTAVKEAAEEREKLLARLQAEHRRTEEILESIDDIFYAVDENFKLTYLNARAEEAWKSKRRDLLGLDLWESIPLLAGSNSQHIHRLVMSERKPAQFEVAMAGQQQCFAVNLYPTGDGGLCAYVRDVSEQRHSEESRALLAALVESSTDSIVSFDFDMKIMSWNRGAERIFGYQRHEVIGRSIEILSPPDQLVSQRSLVERIRTEEVLEQYETQLMRRGGEIFDISLSSSTIKSESGQPLGIMSIIQDITERKRGETELLQLKAELSTELAAMTRLHELSSRLVSASQLQPLLEEVLFAATEFLRADFGAIQLLNRENNELEVVASRGFDADYLNQFKRVKASEGAAGLALSQRRQVLIEDIKIDPIYEPYREIALRLGYRTVLSTPLFDRHGDPVGMLSTHFREPHRVNEIELKLTELYARQAAEMIGARMTENALIQKSAGLQLLFDIAAELLTARDIEGLIDRLYRRLSELIGLTAYFHYRTTEANLNELRLAAWGGVSSQVAETVSEARFDSTISGAVARTKTPMVIMDVQNSSNPRIRLIRKLGVASYACFPLMTQNGVYGTLSFASHAPCGLSSDDLSLMRSMCDLIATAIERKEAEDRLLESENRFRAVADLIPDLLWSNTAHGSTDWYNQRWLEYTGQTFAEAVDYGWLEAVHPDDRANSLRNFHDSLSAGSNLRQEHRIRGADGIYRWFLVQTRPVYDEDGRITRWFGAATEIDDIRNAEAALRRAHNELEVRVQARTAQLAAADDARRRLLRQLVAAQEKEQGAIAREIHDQMGQHLTVLILGLNNVKDHFDSSDAQFETIEGLLAVASDLSEKAHNIAAALHPTALDDLGLTAALQNYVQEWSRWSNIPVDLECIGFETERAPSEIETTIYRVVQEAMTNVLRHGTGTSRVSVIIQRNPGEIMAIVEDNGQGFDAETVLNLPAERRRMGLFGMRERAALVGGTFDLESQPGQGTTIRLRIPVSQK